MSQSTQDYTSFAAKVSSEQGIARQDFRLGDSRMLRLFLVCLFALAFHTVSFAQPLDLNTINWADGMNGGVYSWDGANWIYGANPNPYWDPLYPGMYGGTGQIPGPPGPPAVPNGGAVAYLYTDADNVTGGNRYTQWGVTLQGSVRGVFDTGASPGGRWSHWWVGSNFGGGLYLDAGSVHHMDQLTVQGYLYNDAGSLRTINTINVLGDALNFQGGIIGGAGEYDYIYDMIVSGELVNYAASADAAISEMINVVNIEAGVLANSGRILRTTFGGMVGNEDWMASTIKAGTLYNGNNRRLNSDGSARLRGEAEIVSSWKYDIDVTNNFFQYFDGKIQAREGTLTVGGTLYNAGEISMGNEVRLGRGGVDLDGLTPGADWWYDLNYYHGWNISAQDIFNDGRTWNQWTAGTFPRSGTSIDGVDIDVRSGGSDALEGAAGRIYDAIQLTARGNLTNIGANAVINGSVNTHDGSFMHVYGNLYNLDRASIFNYQEVIVHGDFENRGATFVGGSWFKHSTMTTNNERPGQNRATGLVSIGGNVINRTEYALGGETYGGLIASFDQFDVFGSMINDANSMVTGTYTHSGTAPFEYGYTITPSDPDTPGNATIQGRRASIIGGVMFDGIDYRTSASVLNVIGLQAYSLPGQPAFYGLLNEGQIREIDIINVGSDENGVLMNVRGITHQNASMPTVGTTGGMLAQSTQTNPVPSTPNYSGTITDIGVINTTNLYNSGTISDVDSAINVAYALLNDTTGVLNGLSTSHVEWEYGATGTPIPQQDTIYIVDPDDEDNIIVILGPPVPPRVDQNTRADLRVGKVGDATVNPLASYFSQMVSSPDDVGLVNLGTIENFEHVASLGDMYNDGTISDVTSITVGSNMRPADRADMYNSGTLNNIVGINVSNNLYIDPGSSFVNVGTIAAYNDIEVNGMINGGYRVLSAGAGNTTGTLKVTQNGSLRITTGAIASGNSVENRGLITVEGTLSSAGGIANFGGIINNGMVSAFNNFMNEGTITGNGMVSVAGPAGFVNSTGGAILGGLAVNGNFRSEEGSIIQIQKSSDIIRVSGNAMSGAERRGVATINGGTVDYTAYANPQVGMQHLFLATDSPGDLVVLKELTVAGSGSTGTVLDFTPFYGSWNGSQYVKGQPWAGGSNQFYWIEASRAYIYSDPSNYDVSRPLPPNRRSIARYIDTIGLAPKPDSAFWNLLAQLDGISDNPAHPNFHPDYATHGGTINPAARRALDELEGQIYANVGAASVYNRGLVNRTLADVIRSDVFKFSFIGNPNNAIRGQAIAPLRYTRWGTAFGMGGTTVGDSNSHGYKQTFGGVMAGIDRALWTGTRLGGYFSAATGDVTMRGLHEDIRTTDISVGVYLRQEMYYGYGLVSAGVGGAHYKSDRRLQMLGHRAEAKFNGSLGSLYVERGIDIPIYYAAMQPYLSFQAISARLDKFTERMWDQTDTRANVGLRGVAGETDSFKAAAGMRFSTTPLPFQWGQVAFTGNGAWFHEFSGNASGGFVGKFSNPNGSNFSNSDATFKISGSGTKRDWINFGAGVHMDRNSTRIFASGDLFANGRQTLFSGGGGVITSW